MLERVHNDTWINALGYANRLDVTNIDYRYLVAPSKNVIIEPLDTGSSRVMTRFGIKSCVQVDNIADLKFMGSYKMIFNGKTRFYFSYLHKDIVTNTYNSLYLYEAVDTPCNAKSIKADVLTPSTNTDKVRFTEMQDNLNGKRYLIYAIGNTTIQIYDGSGATTGFTQVLEPMTYGLGTGNNPITGIPNGASPDVVPVGYTIDYIKVYNGQLYIGSKNFRQVYISKVGQYNNFEYSIPRVKGEGDFLLLDTNCRGFESDENSMKILTSGDDIYQVTETNTQGINEKLSLKKLKSSSGQGGIEQELVTKIKNGIMYVSNEKTVDILSNIESFSNTQAVPISDIVQVDFDNFDYTDASMFYHKRNVYFLFPKNTTIMIYNLERSMWQPPVELGINIAGLIADKDLLYGYEYITDNLNGVRVFRMDCFNSYRKTDDSDYALDDDGAGYVCEIRTPYTHLGYRHHQKSHNEIFTEGYISENSKIDMSCYYEYGGAKGIKEDTIYGTRQKDDKVDFIDKPIDTVSLGKAHLGKNNLSNKNFNILPKFHHGRTFTNKPEYYERQIGYKGDTYQQRWGIISFSTNQARANDTNFANRK